MNMQSASGNRIDIEQLRHYPKWLHVSSGSNLSPNETYFDEKRNIYDENNVDEEDSNHNKKHFCCNRIDTKNQSIISPYGHNTMQSLVEQRNTFSQISPQNIFSRYLPEYEYPPKSDDNIEIECKASQNEHNIKQKYSNDAKVSLMVSPDQISEELRAHTKLCSDKTTYCRPVLNLYNQEFLYKTIEKNAKLQRLVTELVIARQKEKEMENWNNYISHLRKKHRRDDKVKHTTSLEFVSSKCGSPNDIEDIYKSNFTCKQSNPCQNLAEDVYKPHDIRLSISDFKTPNEFIGTPKEYIPFKTNPICFPTSSQGRLIMLERERMKSLVNRGYKPLFTTINEEKRIEHGVLPTSRCKGLNREKTYIVRNNRSTNMEFNCKSTQTEIHITTTKGVDAILTKGCNTNYIVHENCCIKEVKHKETAPDNVYYSDNNSQNSSLICIEEKLDNLIHSINNFIIEMKMKNIQHKYFDGHSKMCKRNINYTKSDNCRMARTEKNACECNDGSSRTTENTSTGNFSTIQTIDENLTKINDILLKDIGKNKPIHLKGSSTGETFYPCSVQISVTIPTKDISTEVTRSLSKAGVFEDRNMVIEEIPKNEERRIAIAVNTDPLSLLAMLKVSTEETIKRLLSYVPTIDYYSYLSRLQVPQPRIVESQYVCNICGAAFTKPSALTSHIQKHELGKTRDCCICRHALDSPRRRPGLFKCQYCGQRFTRAYCCELHQEACARRLGKLHDITSSLMLLK